MESGQSEADRLSRHAPSGPDAISQIGRSVSQSSPAVGQTDHAVLVHQASMKSVFSPTQPDTDYPAVMASVVTETQSASQRQSVRH